MARTKADIEAEYGLAVGLVVACALDVKKANAPELIQGTAGLEKLLAAVEQLARRFGWPDDPDGNGGSDMPPRQTKTRH
jgi:hypothetical protein